MAKITTKADSVAQVYGVISEEKTDESVLWADRQVGPHTCRDTGHFLLSLLWDVDLNYPQGIPRIKQWKGLQNCLNNIQEAFSCSGQYRRNISRRKNSHNCARIMLPFTRVKISVALMPQQPGNSFSIFTTGIELQLILGLKIHSWTDSQQTIDMDYEVGASGLRIVFPIVFCPQPVIRLIF